MPKIILILLSAALCQAAHESTGVSAIVTGNVDDEICYSPSFNIGGVTVDQTCIKHDSITRCWYAYFPDSVKSCISGQSIDDSASASASGSECASSSSVPLVIDLHGYNLCSAHSINYTGWSRLAEKFGFAVAWPQGNLNAAATNEPCWSFGDCCCELGDPPPKGEVDDPFARPPKTRIDDVGFLRQVVANVVTRARVDRVEVDTRRLYYAGHSNGCMMAHAMAALSSDLVTAVCCHASSLMVEPSADYKPTPVHVVHGNLDSFIDLFFGNSKHILEIWGEINGCDADISTVLDESGLYATHTRSNCTEGATVQTVELFNVGHYPYLGVSPDKSPIGSYPGAIAPTVDTTVLSWEFCSKFISLTAPKLPEPVGTVEPDSYAPSTTDQEQVSS